MSNEQIDPVVLCSDLIQCVSVTPVDDGALDILENLLSQNGFACTRIDRGGVKNLYARWGDKAHSKSFGFNGHTDVVPIGDASSWSHDPFGGKIIDDVLWGRGATDMKSGVAAFVAAAVDFVKTTPPNGAIVIAITGDEEGDAIDGTTAILDWMDQEGEALDVCLVGEPTCPETMGETIKIGRRGSMNVKFIAKGVQGHSAYPHRARNPVAAMARLIDMVSSHILDEGTNHFDASTLAVTSFDTGNPATNVIPENCSAMVNVRFNDAHTSDGIKEWLNECTKLVSQSTGVDIQFTTRVSGESFVTPPGPLSELVANAVKSVTGVTPELSTSGGTSDARFIKNHCPVIEFGLVGKTMHQVDERVPISQIKELKTIYSRILADYFA